MQPKLGGEISHRARPQNAGVPRSPCAVGIEIFALAAIGVVDPAVQHKLAGTTLNYVQGNFRQQRDRIVIELPPAYGVEIAKQTAGIVVPTPPEVAGQSPQPFLSRRDKTIQGSRFADYRTDLSGGLGEHSHFVFAKDPGRDRLDDENPLQNSTINKRNAQE